MQEPRKIPKCFDPYLAYAIETDFKYFSDFDRDPTTFRLLLLIKLIKISAEEFLREVRQRSHGEKLQGVQIGPTEDSVGYITVRIPKDIALSEAWFNLMDEVASSVTLSLPVKPADNVIRMLDHVQYDEDRPRSAANTIIGIIDDGCAFAHGKLRRAGLSSRVFAIWDQDSRNPIHVSAAPARVFGRKPLDFNYGLEFWRSGGVATATAPAQEIGIDEWIGMHTTPAGTVDEDRCYSHAGFVSLDRRATHGTHVMDVLAGRVPTSGRLSMDRKTPPTFAVSTDVAGAATTDIVFVQIPQEAVNDASGVWLNAQVTDGLRYIMSCAETRPPTQPGQNVIVNVSYGQTTGPHNGTAELEQFMAAMTAEFDGTQGKPRLQVVLPAGNSRRTAAHVQFASTATARRAQWTWRVPPDNPVPVMAEVWVDTADAPAVTGVLSAPAPYVGQSPNIQLHQDATDTHWVIVIPPTQGVAPPLQTTPSSNGPALHGDWTLQLNFAQPGVVVHAYVARTDPNMGARPGARQSRFVDRAWERTNSAAAAQSPGGVAAAPGSLVCPTGTLNGIATADAAGRLHVAAGYRVLGKRCSPYSSGGPSRGARKGPDYALPTDETPSLTGIPGAGTRSGCALRLVGTSTASPQLARLLASSAAPGNCPTINQDPDIGCATLAPP